MVREEKRLVNQDPVDMIIRCAHSSTLNRGFHNQLGFSPFRWQGDDKHVAALHGNGHRKKDNEATKLSQEISQSETPFIREVDIE